MNLFPKTIDLMSDQDRDFLNKKTIDRLNSIAFHLKVIFLSNPDVDFTFWFGTKENGSKIGSLKLSSRDCSIYTGI